MSLEPIKSDADHAEALQRIEQLLDRAPAPGSPEAEELDALTALVQSYESRNYPIEPPDPVEALIFRMEQQNLSHRDLVPFIGSRAKVSEILSRKRPLTLSMIRALHFGLGIPASSLLREAPRSDDAQDLDPSQFPLSLMSKRGWLNATEWEIKNHPAEVLDGFLAPVGTASRLHSAYKQSEHVRSGRSMDEPALFAWTIRVVTKARELSLARYKSGSVTLEFMRSIAKLSIKEDAPALVRKCLSEHGIALCVEPHLPQTYLDGAAVLLDSDCPTVGMTVRYDRIDNFWFTLMHELAHICCHLDSGISVFYDDLEVAPQNNSREKEADSIAREALIPMDVWERSPASKLPTPEAAMHLAKQLGIHPAIAAGRIRYERKNYRLLPNLVGSGEIRRCFPEVSWSIS
jgi:HTH-type transcriptional regulator / antitoxin HigA